MVLNMKYGCFLGSCKADFLGAGPRASRRNLIIFVGTHSLIQYAQFIYRNYIVTNKIVRMNLIGAASKH